MKRSEMLNKLNTLVHCLMKNGNMWDERGSAEKLLNLIESEGMLPPERFKSRYEMDMNDEDRYYSDNEWYNNGKNIGVDVNEWEPEDETNS